MIEADIYVAYRKWVWGSSKYLGAVYESRLYTNGKGAMGPTSINPGGQVSKRTSPTRVRAKHSA